MKSVRQIKEVLDLDTIHQARNRIKAVEEVIQPYTKRGENNEILVGQEGVTVLSKLQDLYESGLLLSEAAEVIRSDKGLEEKEKEFSTDSYATGKDQEKPDTDLLDYLTEEVNFQRQLILALAGEGSSSGEVPGPGPEEEERWWIEWL